MAARALVDTGAILALLNRSDDWHALCAEALKRLPIPLVTSEAVLTELFHLVRVRQQDPEKAWAFVFAVIEVAAIHNSELPHLHALMSQYSDRPMDFADATLVYLAERESLSLVFTIDHGDFQTYRIRAKQPFHIVPQGRP